jgi:hypothetical protein
MLVVSHRDIPFIAGIYMAIYRCTMIYLLSLWGFSRVQWEFQDPEMEVLYITVAYNLRPYFVGILFHIIP